MKLSILLALLAFTSCFKNNKEQWEPTPTYDNQQLNLSSNLDEPEHIGELNYKDITVPIKRYKEQIMITLKPQYKVSADWTFLEEITLTQGLIPKGTEECQANFFTFKDFKREKSYIENLDSDNIEIYINGEKVSEVIKDYKSERFIYQIKNPYLKEINLTIVNKTIHYIHYKKVDLRRCTHTKIIKNRPIYEDYKINKPEYYSFEYEII